MNAIPFVVIFISVIAICWSSLMHSMISTKKSTNGVICHNKTLQKVCDKLERDYFQATKKKESENRTPPDRKDKTYTSNRIKSHKESSKLFISKSPHAMMITAFESLLKELYQECDFFDQRLITRISDELFPMINEDFEWNDLKFKDQVDQEAWYKMLRGEGCPRLTHYITFEESTSLVYARYTSLPVLKALFGEGVAEEILAKEEEKYFDEPEKKSQLSEDEFGAVLSNHNKSEMKRYCNFASSPKVPKVVEASESDLTLEIKLSSNATQ